MTWPPIDVVHQVVAQDAAFAADFEFNISRVDSSVEAQSITILPRTSRAALLVRSM